MRDRLSNIGHVEALIDGESGESGQRPIVLELIEDLGLVINETFKARKALIYTKTAVRAIVKVTGSAVLQAAVDKEHGAGWGLLAGLAGRALSEGTEAADTRGVRYLPRLAYAGGVNLPPGEHELTLRVYSGGRVVKTESYNVTLREGKLNLVEAVCLD
jgi:hypothetical protein